MRALCCAVVSVALIGTVGVAGAAPAPAPAAPPASPAAGAPRRPPAPVQAPADIDQRMDAGFERANAKDYKEAAKIFYGAYRALPEGDLRRDLASYNLASALVELGYTQAGVEHYLEVVTSRRAPETIGKALASLKTLFEKRVVDEDRLVEGAIYGNQYADLDPDVAEFVEYLQALADMRHGFEEWGHKRMDALAQGNRGYAYYARYALAVDRIARHEDVAAAKDLKGIVDSTGAVPPEIRNQARLALARIFYERKGYEEAWRVYSQIDSPLPMQDLVMLEKAWDRTAAGDLQRALGLLVGLGAPVFRDVFAPERDLIRAMALRRLCQYRAAHVTVREYRAKYGPVLTKIRDRATLRDDPTAREWAIAATKPLRDRARMRHMLARERAALKSVGDKPLHDHLDQIYATGLARADGIIARGLEPAMDRVADELLRIDEQLSLIDYEIGAGLFMSGNAKGTARGMRPEDVPYASDHVYFKFDGEYWSDEVRDYTVLTEDRCLR